MSCRLWLLVGVIVFMQLVDDARSAETLLSASKKWETLERGALQLNPPYLEKMIPVHLNPDDPNDERIFYLHYFVARTDQKIRLRRAILFCAGGPGEIVQTWAARSSFAYFLTSLGYDVVFFHLRGSGLSQMPPSNEYDRFIRTGYAVKDMDEIRRDFLGEDGTWDAVIGWSYGSILAQQYASEYSPRDRLKKLVLLGPISRYGFEFRRFYQDVIDIHRHTLERIYRRQEFDDMDRDVKVKITDKVFGSPGETGVFQRTEDAFGSIQFVVDHYCTLRDELEKQNLRYSRKLFQNLRAIRFLGWFPSEDANSDQLKIASTISDEILGESPQSNNDCRDDMRSQNTKVDSRRAFYVMGAYDGIDPRFLREWLSQGEKDISRALTRSAGTAHVEKGVNKAIAKVGIFDNLAIEAWDPEKFAHGVPTLILKGGADPVSASGGAEYIFSRGLTGQRTLVEFPGIGHNYLLPKMLTDSREPKSRSQERSEKFLSGTIHLESVNILPGEIREAIGNVNGSELNDGLKIKLEPSTVALSMGLHHRGFGILEEEKIEDPDKSKNNVVALIENTTNVDVGAGKIPWIIGNGYFSGTVVFDVPRIPARQIRAVRGTITNGKQNVERQLQFVPPKLTGGLEFVCAAPVGLVERGSADSFQKKLSSSSYELFLKNTGTEASKTSPRYWTVKNAVLNESVHIKVDPPMLEPGTAGSVTVVLEDMSIDPEAELTLVKPRELDPRLLVSCVLSPQDDSTDVSIVLHNVTREAVRDEAVREWTIKAACFDATFEVGPLQVGPNEIVAIRAKLKGVTWKKRLELIRPSALEREIELLGFNIIGPDKISVLLRNNGRTEVRTKARSWTYIDPNKPTVCIRASDKAQAGGSRECLIYSFLAMDPGEFTNSNDNKVLDIVRSLFSSNNPQESLPIRVEYCEKGTCMLDR